MEKESNKNLKTLCTQIVQDFITYSLKVDLMKQDEIEKATTLLIKSAQGATYSKKYPDSAGAGPKGVRFGEYFRKTIDGVKSFYDPILDKDFAVRMILFHEFTHVLQLANLKKKHKGENFHAYKQSANYTMKRKHFSGLQEFTASLATQHLWEAYKNDAKPYKHGYYTEIVATGLAFLKTTKMTERNLIRATTFEPELLENLDTNDFTKFLKNLDSLIPQ